MSSSIKYGRSILWIVSILLFVYVANVSGQQKRPLDDQGDVIRINTDLEQTGVVVSDKAGRFVDGLKREQFEVHVDGKPMTISFFDRVVAGTVGEAKQLAAFGGTTTQTTRESGPDETYHGRMIIFFVDDRHLGALSVEQTRRALLQFVEKEMGPLDQVAVVSASGRIGFLQQFSDQKAVLRKAISRIEVLPSVVQDTANPPLTEYVAFRIGQGDKDALTYYTNDMLRSLQFTYSLPKYGGKGPGFMVGTESDQAQRMVAQRAQTILARSAANTAATLKALDSCLRSLAQSPMRKYVFFISDGFLMHDAAGLEQEMQRITDAAARYRAVIYTANAQQFGHISSGNTTNVDASGRPDRFSSGESDARQGPLDLLAKNTGGRVLLNSNVVGSMVSNTIKGDLNYYLLAWHQNNKEQKSGNFSRIEVTIPGRPDLTVRSPDGFLTGEVRTQPRSAETTTAQNNTGNASQGDEAALSESLTAAALKEVLPTQLSLSFLDIPGNGPALTISMQMALDGLGYGPDGTQPAAIDIAGVVVNDQGQSIKDFKKRVLVSRPTSDAGIGETSSVMYNHKVLLKPGVYQVRIAARDEKTGRAGSAFRWIEIPDLASRKLTLSTLLVGGQFVGSNQSQGAGAGTEEQVQFSIDRRFRRDSHMNFLAIIYNATRNANGAPHLESQAQISHNGQTILTSPMTKVVVDSNTDPARIPYGANVALRTLRAGRYVLQVRIYDRFASSSVMQYATFDVE